MNAIRKLELQKILYALTEEGIWHNVLSPEEVFLRYGCSGGFERSTPCVSYLAYQLISTGKFSNLVISGGNISEDFAKLFAGYTLFDCGRYPYLKGHELEAKEVLKVLGAKQNIEDFDTGEIFDMLSSLQGKRSNGEGVRSIYGRCKDVLDGRKNVAPA